MPELQSRYAITSDINVFFCHSSFIDERKNSRVSPPRDAAGYSPSPHFGAVPRQRPPLMSSDTIIVPCNYSGLLTACGGSQYVFIGAADCAALGCTVLFTYRK